jgi:phage replication-related protein YjqB (UPF0714/DUF867 family)
MTPKIKKSIYLFELRFKRITYFFHQLYFKYDEDGAAKGGRHYKIISFTGYTQVSQYQTKKYAEGIKRA